MVTTVTIYGEATPHRVGLLCVILLSHYDHERLANAPLYLALIPRPIELT